MAEVAEKKNIKTHIGTVHAPGRSTKATGIGYLPLCCASASAVDRFHFLAPTDEPMTCKRCLTAQAKNAG